MKPDAKRGARSRSKLRGIGFAGLAIPAVAVPVLLAVCLAALLHKSPAPDPEAPGRYGTIVQYVGGERCRHMTFDNSTGRIAENSPSCDRNPVVDRGGTQAPRGTTGVLGAISKSFH
jgi:hypothetical protein